MQAQQRSHRSRIGVLAILLVSSVFTAIQIRHSLAAGRLADPPTWDDVVYLDDAVVRLHQIKTQPFGIFLTGMLRNPPHSLYSVMMAALGLCLGGVRDWMPYATNGLWVVALLFSASSLMRQALLWQRVLLFLLVLTMPLTAILVTEYRPDLIWGFSSAMAVFSVLRWRWIGASRGHQVMCGFWLAAALICKTSTFPLTLLTVGTAWLSALFCERAERPAQFDVRKILAAVFWSALPSLLSAVPYYILEARPILGYIQRTLMGPDRNRWMVHGSSLDQARYFLDGGGRIMMRNHFYLLGVILIGGGSLWIGCCRRRGKNAWPYRGFCISGITFIAYLVPTLNPSKNPFFGAEFQFLLLLSAIAVVDAMVGSSLRTLRVSGNALLIVTAVTATACLRFPAPVGTSREPDTARLVRAIVSTVQGSSTIEPRVLLTVIGGRLNSSTLDYVSWQMGKHVNYFQPAYNATVSQIASHLDQYDFILAGETGVGDVLNQWTPNQVSGVTLDLIRADPHFECVMQLETCTGKRLLIYRRDAK